MSSEAEARERLLIAVSLFTRGMSQAEFGRTYPKQAAEILAALDAYKEQIERRVLAQQPCYRTMIVLESNQTWSEPCDCNPCTARQTQETSG